MAFPTIDALLLQFVLVAVGVPLIYVFSRVFKIRSTPIAISKPKREAALASVVIVALFLVVFGWNVMIQVLHFFHTDSQFVIGPSELLWRFSLDGVCLAIIAVAMRSTGQRLESIGVSRSNIGRMVALGLVMSAVLLVYLVFAGGGIVGLSPLLLYGFFFCISVGFGEEICWRGYIQTRFAASVSNLGGLVLTSLLFAVLWHFPSEFYAQSGAVLDALLFTLTRLAPGLLFGYLMMRSKNVLPSSVFHIFWDWSILLVFGAF